MYGIMTDAAIQILFVIAATLALNWCLAERDRAKARRRQAIAKALERLHAVTQPLNLEKVNDGGAAVRFMRQKFAAEDERRFAGMLQMAERVAEATAAVQRLQKHYSGGWNRANGNSITVKRGVADFKPGMTASKLIPEADRRMLDAKLDGMQEEPAVKTVAPS